MTLEIHQFQIQAIQSHLLNKYLPVLVKEASDNTQSYYLLINASSNNNKTIPMLVRINLFRTEIVGENKFISSINISSDCSRKIPCLYNILSQHFGSSCGLNSTGSIRILHDLNFLKNDGSLLELEIQSSKDIKPENNAIEIIGKDYIMTDKSRNKLKDILKGFEHGTQEQIQQPIATAQIEQCEKQSPTTQLFTFEAKQILQDTTEKANTINK